MSIASEFDSTIENIKSDYEGLENLGIDTTNIDKNIYNIRTCLDTIYSTLPKATGTGSNITLQPTLKGKLQIDKLLGDTTQEGTPTPDSPQDIEVVTGQQDVVVQNKNLYDSSYRASNNTIYVVNGTATESNGTFTLTATGTDLYMWQVASSGGSYNKDINGKLYSFTDEAYTITISNTTMIANYITFYDENKVSLGFISFGGAGYTKTFTKSDSNVPSGAKYFSIRIGYNNATVGNTYSFNVMLEKGSTATPYVEHQEQTKTLHLGDIELAKIGNYIDNLFEAVEGNSIYDSLSDETKATLTSGKWYIEKNIGKVVLNGSEANWSVQNTGTANWFYRCIDSNIAIINDSTSTNTMCDHYTWGSVGNSNTNTGYYIVKSTTEIRIRYGTEDTITNYKTWLASNNVELLYVLATPTYTEITNETLIEQLNELKKMMSYNGQTNISISGNLPMIINVSALKGE